MRHFVLDYPMGVWYQRLRLIVQKAKKETGIHGNSSARTGTPGPFRPPGPPPRASLA
jgi:hypothetical protein